MGMHYDVFPHNGVVDNEFGYRWSRRSEQFISIESDPIDSVNRRLLVVDDPGRFKSKFSIPGEPGRQRFYTVKETILEDN